MVLKEGEMDITGMARIHFYFLSGENHDDHLQMKEKQDNTVQVALVLLQCDEYNETNCIHVCNTS